MAAKRFDRRLLGALAVPMLMTWCPGEAAAQLTPSQQRCMDTMNRDLGKGAGARGRVVLKCIKDRTKKKILAAEVEGCLTSDPNGKIAKATERTTRDFTNRCTGNDGDGEPKLPPFGVTTSGTVSAAATSLDLAVMHSIYGSDLGATIIPDELGPPFGGTANKYAGLCQRNITKATQRCRQRRLKAWRQCVKVAMKEGTANDDATLWSTCLGSDPKGKIADKCDPQNGDLRGSIDGACEQITVAGNWLEIFPGCLGFTADADQLAACFDFFAECHTCLALAISGNLDAAACPSNCAFQGADPCGNLLVAVDEECDDGNTADGDGCSSECFCNPATAPPTCDLTGAWEAIGYDGDTLVFTEDASGDSTSSGSLGDFDYTGQGSRSDSCGLGTAILTFGSNTLNLTTRYTVNDGCDTINVVLENVPLILFPPTVTLTRMGGSPSGAFIDATTIALD